MHQWKIEKRIESVCNNPRDHILDIGAGKSPLYHRKIKGEVVRFDLKDTNAVDVLGNAQSLPFKEGIFDKIVSVNTLYYCTTPSLAFGEMSRVLKKNGAIVIVTPFMYPIHDVPEDKYRFTEFAMRSFLERRFADIKVECVGGIFSQPLVALHALIKGIPLTFHGHMRKAMMGVLLILLFLPYLIAQLISLLDTIDKTGRFPVYYITIARKK